MNSEENYLDQLLNSMTQSAPKERSMDEVLREMMGAEPEPVPVPVQEEAVSTVSEAPLSEALADMIDALEDPSLFLNAESKSEESTEVEIPAEEVPLEEISADNISMDDISLDEVLAEILPDEAISTEEPVIEEVPVDIPVEIPAEEPAIEEAPVEIPTEELVMEEVPVDIPAEESVIEEVPADIPAEEPVIEEVPVDIPVDIPAEEPVIEDVPLDIPAEEPVIDEVPVDIPAEEPVMEEVPVEVPAEEPVMEEVPVEIPAEEPVTEAGPAMEEFVFDENNITEETLEAMLKGIDTGEYSDYDGEDDASVVESTEVPLSSAEELDDDAKLLAEAASIIDEEQTVADDNSDMADLLGALGNAEDLSIQETPELSAAEMLDNIGDSGEDLLALLEGIDENPDYNEEAIDSEETSTEDKKGRKKKRFSLPFFKKKNKASEEEEQEENNSADINDIGVDGVISADADAMDAILQTAEEEAQADELASLKDISDVKEKKPGFLSKLVAILFGEDEEEEEEPAEKSNEDILAEVDAENAEEATNQKKKGKKEKKSKKDKKAPKGDAEGEEGSGDSEGEGEDSPKKKKKEKKVKEPKEPKPKEPSKRVLSKKAAAGLVAFCATIIAAVFILSTILPEHADLKRARAAYFAQDYNVVFDELYGKKLNESDQILFNRAKTVLMLSRRFESYENRMKMGQKVEALDSLIEGLFVYDSLLENGDLEVKGQLDEIHEKILLALSTEFNLSREQAVEIYSFDDESYTRKLYSIVYGESLTVNPEANTEILSEDLPEDFSEDIPEEMPVDIPENVSEDTAEEIPMPDMLDVEGDL